MQNDDVEMRAEDLFISAQEVSVKYRFFNKADKDVTVLVAFPMPEVRISEQDQNISLPTEDPVNILAFKTSADGQPVTTKVEQRVFAVGIERTQYLRDLGIPLAPHVRATGEALDKLPPEKWDELLRLGLAELEEYDIGKGMQKHLAPRWGLKTTFYWEQTFPATACRALRRSRAHAAPAECRGRADIACARCRPRTRAVRPWWWLTSWPFALVLKAVYGVFGRQRNVLVLLEDRRSRHRESDQNCGFVPC